MIQIIPFFLKHKSSLTLMNQIIIDSYDPNHQLLLRTKSSITRMTQLIIYLYDPNHE